MELHCIRHSFHHDLLKACKRFSLCMQKKYNVGKLEQKRWWSDLWTLDTYHLLHRSPLKILIPRFTLIALSFQVGLVILGYLVCEGQCTPLLLFPSIPRYLAPHPTLSLYVGQTGVTHSCFTPILLLPLNTPKKLKVKGYRWWAAWISWKLQVQMEGASPSY
jgi:hypothetical protein